MYVYIYIERERDIYIYIYIHMYICIYYMPSSCARLQVTGNSNSPYWGALNGSYQHCSAQVLSMVAREGVVKEKLQSNSLQATFQQLLDATHSQVRTMMIIVMIMMMIMIVIMIIIK